MKKQKHILIATLISVSQLVSLNSNAQTWSSVGTGMNGPVYSICFSSTGFIAAGGYFTSAGGNTANYVAQWNGTGWSAMGSCTSPYFYCGANAEVQALYLDGDLYAGGSFTTAEGVSAPYISKWDGTGWSSINTYFPNNIVKCFTQNGSNLIIGGTFTELTNGFINYSAANYIVEWNTSGSYWTTLGSGMNGTVLAVAMYGGNLYAGGQFTTAGGNSTSYIAKWNGTSWSAVGTGMNGYVTSLVVVGSNLYAAGYFTTAGGNTANYVAMWNGTSWSAVGSGMNNTVNVLATDGTTLFAGGNFTTAGGNTANYVAYWNGTTWSPFGTGTANGTNSTVYALCIGAGNAWVGGNFSKAGGVTENYIAKYGITYLAPDRRNIVEGGAEVAKIVPNPSNGSFSMALDNVNPNTTVTIYNMIGEQVYKSLLSTTGNTQIELGHQAAGLYLYRINDSNNNILSTGKVMIQ